MTDIASIYGPGVGSATGALGASFAEFNISLTSFDKLSFPTSSINLSKNS